MGSTAHNYYELSMAVDSYNILKILTFLEDFVRKLNEFFSSKRQRLNFRIINNNSLKKKMIV